MPLAAIILAAGNGTRMKSSTPKVLHNVGGMPLLGHVLSLTRNLEITETVVIIGHGSEKVKEYIKSNEDRSYCVNQPTQLGTGNAVQCATETLKNFEGNLIILSGDVPFVRKETVEKMLNELAKGADLAVLGFQTPNPKHYGRIILKEDNSVSEIVEEKDATENQRSVDLCNAGIYCGKSDVIFSLIGQLKNENAASELYLTDIVKIGNIKDLKTILVECDEDETQGINNRQDLAKAEFFFQEKLRKKFLESGVTLIDPKTIYFSYDTAIEADTTIHPNVIFGPSVKIESGVDILPFSHLEGCTIAKGSKIGPFTRIRPKTNIEENVKVGNFVEIKNAHLKKYAKVNHLSYIGDASIGSQSNIGAGTIFCNYDGASKHFTEIGENAFVGSNSSLIAPIKIGSNTIIGSGSVITEDVPDGDLAIGRQKQKNKKGLGKKLMEKLNRIRKPSS